MTKLTFVNENKIMVNGYHIGNAIPAKAPTLKQAAKIAIEEINNGITPDCFVSDVSMNGDFKDVSFENGAVLTVPSDYNVIGYKQALEIVVAEIDD